MPKDIRIIKERLYSKYGLYCEVCKKKFKKSELTGHHIIERHIGGKTTEENILIACYHCHFGIINNMKWGSKEYWDLINKSLEHRKRS